MAQADVPDGSDGVSDRGPGVVGVSVALENRPAQTARRTSRSALIDALSADIISGAITGGTHMDEAGLCRRFGLSRTPVREALRELCARDLADHIPYRGVIVRAFSGGEIEALFEAMSEMEALCGRLAAVRMGIGDRARLIELHETMIEQARAGDHEGYTATNLAFHDLIYDGSGNREIVLATQAIRAKIAPYRRYQLQDAGRLQRSCDEHGAICEAILVQSGPAAELALKRHLVSAAHEVILRRSRHDEGREGHHDDV